MHVSRLIDGKSDTRHFCEACFAAEFGPEQMLRLKRRSQEEVEHRLATDPEFKARVEGGKEKRTQEFTTKLDELCLRDPRFSREAYEVVFASLRIAIERKAKPVPPTCQRHVTAAELVRACEEHARKTWGDDAKEHLATLGLRISSNLGDVVFQLINNGFMGKQAEDDRRDFDSLPFLDD